MRLRQEEEWQEGAGNKLGIHKKRLGDGGKKVGNREEKMCMTACVYGVSGKELLGCSQHKREEVLNMRRGDKRARKRSHRLGFGEGKGEEEGS
jgi:hypothetical protein